MSEPTATHRGVGELRLPSVLLAQERESSRERDRERERPRPQPRAHSDSAGLAGVGVVGPLREGAVFSSFSISPSLEGGLKPCAGRLTPGSGAMSVHASIEVLTGPGLGRATPGEPGRMPGNPARGVPSLPASQHPVPVDLHRPGPRPDSSIRAAMAETPRSWAASVRRPQAR